MKAISVDIETLSTVPSAQILSIGATYFDTHTGEEFGHYSANIDKSLGFGRSVDIPTLAWWGKAEQAEAADALNHLPRPLFTVLAEFADWVGKCPHDEVWAKSPNFDLVILEDAYHYVPPFNFRQYRDVRTLISTAEHLGADTASVRKIEPCHDALNDARYQANVVSYCNQYLEKLWSQ